MIVKIDGAQQRSILELAEVDAEISRLGHRAAHLPEQQRYDEIVAEHRAASDRAAVLELAIADVDSEIARLEGEVEAVRRREDRDRGLLDSGSVNPKQLEELAHELGTLQRRQASLEDALLEVMERREQLAADHAGERASAAVLESDADTARDARDRALAEIDLSRAERAARRDELIAALDPELADLYDRQRAAAGIGAGRLQAGRCGACRIELDRGELSRISAAPEDDLLRCPECRAILVRAPK